MTKNRNLKQAFIPSLDSLMNLREGILPGNVKAKLNEWGVAFALAGVSFALMLFAEYERETE